MGQGLGLPMSYLLLDLGHKFDIILGGQYLSKVGPLWVDFVFVVCDKYRFCVNHNLAALSDIYAVLIHVDYGIFHALNSLATRGFCRLIGHLSLHPHGLCEYMLYFHSFYQRSYAMAVLH